MQVRILANQAQVSVEVIRQGDQLWHHAKAVVVDQLIERRGTSRRLRGAAGGYFVDCGLGPVKDERKVRIAGMVAIAIDSRSRHAESASVRREEIGDLVGVEENPEQLIVDLPHIVRRIEDS